MNIGGIFCRQYSDFRVVEKGGMLPELISHLVNDERAAGREGVVCILKQGAFLFDIENTEGNAGNNVIALRDAAEREFLGQTARRRG